MIHTFIVTWLFFHFCHCMQDDIPSSLSTLQSKSLAMARPAVGTICHIIVTVSGISSDYMMISFFYQTDTILPETGIHSILALARLLYVVRSVCPRLVLRDYDDVTYML